MKIITEQKVQNKDREDLPKLEDKCRELEDHHRHMEHMKEVIHDLKRRGAQPDEVLEKENRKLKIKCELLEEQNEQLLDRLAG